MCFATVCSVTGLLPGANCPKTSRVRIALPADEEGETDDSKYAMPTRHCSGHTSVTVDPSYLGPDEAGDGSGRTGVVPGLGPGGASTRPSFGSVERPRTGLIVFFYSLYQKR